MSIIIIKVKNEENISIFKKFAKALEEKLRVIKDEEYEDSLISALIDEGLKTEIVPEEMVRKEFRKHGVDF